MMKKRFMPIVLMMTLLASTTTFAEEYPDWAIKADGYYDEDYTYTNEDMFWLSAEIRNESDVDLEAYLSLADYVSPGEANVDSFQESQYRWIYGTVSLIQNYDNGGCEIWITAIDPAYPEGTGNTGWNITSNVPVQGDAVLREGDTVVVIGNAMSYDDGFSNELYIGGAHVLITSKSFDQVYSAYKDAIVKYR